MHREHIYSKAFNAVSLGRHDFPLGAFLDVIGFGHSAQSFVF